MTARDPAPAGKGPRRPPYTTDGALGSLCIVPVCFAVTGPDHLMCAADWARVPRELRDAVWREYRDGAALLTLDYQTAVREAVDAAERAAVTR